MGEDRHPSYRVHCGSTNVVIDELEHETIALVVATDHETVHRCGAWWERPFAGVSFYAPNVADPPRAQR